MQKIDNWSQFSAKPNWASKSDSRKALITGCCECNGIKYELFELPKEIQQCYCSMCVKIHGTINSVAWSPMKESNIHFVSNDTLTYYKSSRLCKRGYCNHCGSKVYLKYEYQRGLIWLTTALFHPSCKWYNDHTKKQIVNKHIYLSSKYKTI